MSDLSEIVRGYETIKRAEANGVLATVVKVTGSAQQRSGTRILIHEDRSITGSSGDSDLDVVLSNRALTLLGSGEPMSVVFEVGSTIAEGNSRGPSSFGVIHFLLEPLPFSVRSSHVRFIQDCLQSRTPGVIASIFRVEGEIQAKVGAHVFLRGDGRIEEDVKNPVLVAAITEDCVLAMQSKCSITKEYRLTEGVAEAVTEFIEFP